MTGHDANSKSRAAAAGFFERLAKLNKREVALAALPPSSAPPAISRSVSRRIEALHYADQCRRWLVASVTANAVVLVLLVVALTATYFRPVYTFKGSPSLSEASRAFYGDQTMDKDQLYMFVLYTLGTLNQVNHQGAPYLPLLQGAVDPAIYSRTKKDVDRNLVEIRKNLITQSLIITAITDVIFDEKTNKLSAYVMGELGVIAGQSTAGVKPVVIPYRARVVMSVNTPSKINPFPYFLSALEQRFDKRAIEWDATQLKNQ